MFELLPTQLVGSSADLLKSEPITPILVLEELLIHAKRNEGDVRVV